MKKYSGIVTGAGGLLGYYHAEALLQLGYEVHLVDINLKSLKNCSQKLEKKFKKKIYYYYLDVSNEKQIINFYKKIYKNFNLKVLINNAAIDYKVNKNISNSMLKFNLTRWNKEIAVGLTGYFLMAKNILKFSNEELIILNIASDLSVIAPNHDLYFNKKTIYKPITYSVIKHAILGLTKYIAVTFAKKSIRCNSLSPGGILNNQPKYFLKRIKKLIPLGRMAKPNEYIGAVKFLCSSESEYLTGQNIIVDGGRTII